MQYCIKKRLFQIKLYLLSLLYPFNDLRQTQSLPQPSKHKKASPFLRPTAQRFILFESRKYSDVLGKLGKTLDKGIEFPGLM